MKKFSILIIMLLVLMSSIVMAVEPWETTDDAWQELPRTIYDEQVFGDKYTFWDRISNIGLFAFIEQDEYLVTASGFTAETTWRDIGNMKYGYFADPTSFTGYLTSPPPQDFMSASGKYEVVLGNACSVGDYVAVLYANSYDTSPNKWAFSNFYYKAFSGDSIRATQYWIKDLPEATISYRCFSADITTIEYMCLSGKIYQDNNYMTSCDSGECSVYKFASETQYTNSNIESRMCEPEVTCYQCSGSSVTSKTFATSCDTGWFSTPPVCNVPITCYQCDNGQVATQTFNNNCGTGWSTTRPQICPVTCYYCDNGNVVNANYDGLCPTGTSATRPASCDVPLDTCYQCQDGENGVVLSELLPSCETPWTTKELSRNDCSNGGCDIFCKAKEFYNDNTTQFWIIAIAIIIIVVAIIISVKPPKKPQGVVRL